MSFMMFGGFVRVLVCVCIHRHRSMNYLKSAVEGERELFDSIGLVA